MSDIFYDFMGRRLMLWPTMQKTANIKHTYHIRSQWFLGRLQNCFS